jgi:hypothetical protein
MKTILRTVSSMLLVIGAVLCILISNSDAAEWTVGPGLAQASAWELETEMGWARGN